MNTHRPEFEHIAPGLLTESPQNPRTHNRKQKRQLQANIRKYGFQTAVLIDECNRIIAGHLRVQVAVEEGLETVPCIRVVGLSERDKRALLVADNAIGLGAGWDYEILASTLEDLTSVSFDFDIIGFEQGEVDIILADKAEASPEPRPSADKQFEPPEGGTAVCRLGDLFVLGRHRLLCGSSRVALDVDRVMGGEMARMVFADPPYNVEVPGNVSGLGKTTHRNFKEASGEMSPAQYEGWLREIFTQIERVCCNGAIVYICIDWRHLQEVLAAGYDVFADLKNLCVWAKTNAGMGTFYRSQHELVLVWKVGDEQHTNNFGLGETGRHRSNLWTYAGVNTFRADRMEELRAHPTPKPVAMVADAIKDVSKRGEVVFDPFGGSGTTLIAAEKTGRSARLIEIDPGYCDVIIRRWQTLTGKRATLDGTWDDFEALQEKRMEQLSKEDVG